MNKFNLIGLSLMVLIISVGFVCASEIDDSLPAVDHNSIDEISSSDDIDIQQDVSDHAIADHIDNGQNDVRDSVSVDKTNDYPPVSTDIQTQQDNEQTNTVSQTNDNAYSATNTTDANQAVLIDNVIKDSSVKVANSTDINSNQPPTTVKIFDDTPKETNTSAQKQNLLRPDIEKYNKFYQKIKTKNRKRKNILQNGSSFGNPQTLFI